MIKAFIFDLDGTLLDSMAFWNQIGEKYLKSININIFPNNLSEILRPMSLLDAANYFIKEFKLDKTSSQICNEVNSLVENNYRFNVELKAGVKEFLENNGDKKMCIATATDKFLAELALKRLDLLDKFSFIITSSEIGNSKENPDIYLESAKMLGEKIDSCAVFEDALHAIKTAKNAGFYTVGIFEPCFKKEAEEIKKYSNQFVENLLEVEL